MPFFYVKTEGFISSQKLIKMNKIVILRVKKDISHIQELKILKMKGVLITKGFTEIIHIKDENEEFYLNSFSISPQDKMQVEEFIKEYIIANGFADIISVL